MFFLLLPLFLPIRLPLFRPRPPSLFFLPLLSSSSSSPSSFLSSSSFFFSFFSFHFSFVSSSTSSYPPPFSLPSSAVFFLFLFFYLLILLLSEIQYFPRYLKNPFCEYSLALCGTSSSRWHYSSRIRLDDTIEDDRRGEGKVK